MAIELFGSAASRLHQSSLPSSGSAFYGKAGECLIRRTAVVRTRMPGGVGGVAPRDAPLSRLTAVSTAPCCPGSGGRRHPPQHSCSRCLRRSDEPLLRRLTGLDTVIVDRDPPVYAVLFRRVVAGGFVIRAGIVPDDDVLLAPFVAVFSIWLDHVAS